MQEAWDQLTATQQAAITNSGMIGQLLKNNLTILGTDLVDLIVEKTDIPADTVTSTLITLAGMLGLTTTDLNEAVKFLQSKLTTAASNEEWNGLLSIILNAGATILSGGSLNWASIAIGLGEWAYNNIIAKKLPSAVVLPTPAPVEAALEWAYNNAIAKKMPSAVVLPTPALVEEAPEPVADISPADLGNQALAPASPAIGITQAAVDPG